MKLTLGFSPCPNDTFMFDALVNKKIDTGDLEFDVILEDVETLNRLALNNTLDFSKISYAVLPILLKNYLVLNSGSALGSGVGPLLVCNKETDKNEINHYTIVIPGEHTTAHMLFSLAFPEAKNKIFVRYNEIEDLVLSSKDNVAGVIIHENRFTYRQKGLYKILDLGEYWEETMHSPIPLGGIIAKRNIDNTVLKKTESLIKQSIEFSFSNYPVIPDYVRTHSQEMDEDVMRKHIDLYVNDHSIELEEKGKNAVLQMLGINRSGVINRGSIFLE